MATYHDWNDAIIRYVTHGLSIGSRVFLSIDDETLETIGFMFGEPRAANGWSHDFIESIRSYCVDKDRVDLSRLVMPSLRDSQNRPRYIGFLAAMVLAAHYMGNEGGDKPLDAKDYFTHFNRILGVTNQQGRTKGLDAGEDERLWQDWSAWLRIQGFLPTVRSGDGAYRYIGYPISQALLRQSDKNSLWRYFYERRWQKNYDKVLLMQRIRRDSQYLTTHLQEILDSEGDVWIQSHEAISNVCYEVYEEWREADDDERRVAPSEPRIRTSLDARIYRAEDFFAGAIEYRIFPRQTRQSSLVELNIEFRDQSYVLAEERPGWYLPLWTVDSEQLSNGVKVPVSSSSSTAIKNLFLPAHNFWVLTLDPDIPESGIYASWDKNIELGTEFILLVSKAVQSDLTKLKDEGLLDWQMQVPVLEDWYEYRGVTVLSEPHAWSGLNLVNEELRLTLQPRTSFSINLIGGLRVPHGHGWLIRHEPKLSIASFLPDAELSVFDEADKPIYTATIEAGQSIEVPFSSAGNYRVVISQNGHSEEKVVRILDWQHTTQSSTNFEENAKEFSLPIYGALVVG